MKHSAFTMIELIFVIVIIGILSAVAVPKFFLLSDEAKTKICESYVGTLNRTTGQTVWSKSISNGNEGLVTTYIDTYDEITHYITPPSHCQTTNLTIDSSFLIGENTYIISFVDGTSHSGPKWTWTKQ